MSKKTSNVGDVLPTNQEPLTTIKHLIFTIRGQQVMLDRDLARLYGVETKRINEAVKRNIERFPDDFMFKLNKEEAMNLRSQFVTSSLEVVDNELEDESNCSRSQFATLKTNRGDNIKYLPYAFTENGIAMLSGVLKSETAINVNIQIMRAFVAMRHTLLTNSQLFSRMEVLESNQLRMLEWKNEAESKFEEIFNTLNKHHLPIEGLFYENQIYDAYELMTRIVKMAENRIVVIDNYVDDTVLTLLSKRTANVSAEIYTYKMNQQFSLDVAKHNAQYPNVEVYVSKKSHDRFLIIDDKVYHVGASIKDLGKKLCAVTLLNSVTADEVIGKVR